MVPSANSTARAQILQHLLHGPDVLDVRDVVQDARARRQQRRRHELEGRVLGPRDGHLSRTSARPPRTSRRPRRRSRPRRRHFSGHLGDFETVVGAPQRQLLPVRVHIFPSGTVPSRCISKRAWPARWTCDVVDVDLRRFLGRICQHDHLVELHFGEALGHREIQPFPAGVERPQPADGELSDQGSVTRQDAQLTLVAGSTTISTSPSYTGPDGATSSSRR